MNVETLTPAAASETDHASIGKLLDRWIYVFMAAFFIVTTLVAFVPDSIQKLGAMRIGQRPPFAPIVHVHAVLMGVWLMLQLTQSLLEATGRRRYHRQLGLASLPLFPALVAAMIGITFSGWHMIFGPTPPSFPAPLIAQIRGAVSNILLEQIRRVILFTVFVVWAVIVRKRDPESHKRLWIMATMMVLSASIDRLRWLPTTLPASFDSQYAYLIVWLAPALIVDLVTRGRPHKIYVIGTVLVIPFFMTTHFLWNSPWWLATAPRLMGVAH